MRPPGQHGMIGKKPPILAPTLPGLSATKVGTIQNSEHQDEVRSLTRNWMTRGRVRLAIGVIAAALLITFALAAGKMLVVDAPRPSDLILVLAGETDHRPAHALELLHQGYGK